MAWELDYREIQALYCTCKAYYPPPFKEGGKPPKVDEPPEYYCPHGLLYELRTPDGPALLKRLLKSDNVLEDIADIANRSGNRIDPKKWKDLKVVFRDFDAHGVTIPRRDGKEVSIPEEDILITPKAVYIPWPPPYTDPDERGDVAEEFRAVTETLQPQPLQQSDLYAASASPTLENLDKEYLLYSQLAKILETSHPDTLCLTDDQLRSYVEDPKAYLQQFFGFLLPEHMKVEGRGDTWDCTIICHDEVQAARTRWTMRVRGLNARPKYDLLMQVKIPELHQRWGLNIEDIVVSEDEYEMLIRIPEQWRRCQQGLAIKDIVIRKDDWASYCADRGAFAAAADSTGKCTSQCPELFNDCE